MRIIELREVYEDAKRWYLVTDLEEDMINFYDKRRQMGAEFGESQAAQIIKQLL